VDQELSATVRRHFSTVSHQESAEETVLRTVYEATTNRMLRVAVNSFMDSIQLVIDVMAGLDLDVMNLKAPAN
jgi:EKC/KEOPS complex subunit PCC1/LAGE3